jgi:RHS repeat-associated protein
MALLPTDTLGNVLLAPHRGGLSALRLSYLPFGGHTSAPHNHMALHGQLNERPLDGYLLGNGYRLYLPQVMRFVQADSLSPFGAGGVNAYAFCGGEPINRKDSDGAAWYSALAKLFRLGRKTENIFAVSFPKTIIDPKGKTELTFRTPQKAKIFLKKTLGTSIEAESYTEKKSLKLWKEPEPARKRLASVANQLGVPKDYLTKKVRASKIPKERQDSYLLEIGAKDDIDQRDYVYLK